MSGGTRKYLFISSSLHRPFGGCFLLQAAKLVEVGRNIAVLSLDEGSCDDLPGQAPKSVKLSVSSLDEGGSAEVVYLVGRLTPWLGPVVIYSAGRCRLQKRRG